jgi:four helix bundle protein
MELGKLEIYRLALKLSHDTWKLYGVLSKRFQFSIGEQTLRAIDSVGANIAEGYGRYHYRDSIKFYYNARGSLWEAKHWLYLLSKRDLIEKKLYGEMMNDINLLGKKLNNFIESIKKRATNDQ